VETSGTTTRARWRVSWIWPLLAVAAIAALWTAPRPTGTPAPKQLGAIAIEATEVPLNADDLSVTTLGDFRYGGGVVLTSSQTNLLHELSGLTMTASDRFVAVGDEGVLLEARLVLDAGARLIGVTDATLTRLTGENGEPLTDGGADAEGLALLPNGDRLVSFEKEHRILLYPKAGGPPREIPSPRVAFPFNAGMEALTAAPDLGADGYMVGAEDSGETWTCHVSASCVQGPTVEKPEEFGLVAIERLPGGMTAFLLRAYDPVRHNRITLEIHRGDTIIARMDMAPPLTVDNFEAMTSVANADGSRRFYLLSDDNNRDSQRTLLLAFDWQPR
jgi:hypothetical protein